MSQRMRRTQIYLTDAQYHFLQEKAELKETSMADVIRHLIDKYLPKEKDYKRNPLFELDRKNLPWVFLMVHSVMTSIYIIRIRNGLNMKKIFLLIPVPLLPCEFMMMQNIKTLSNVYNE